MTGPFCPIAPWWMCAATPLTPVVLTSPVTDLSIPTAMLLVPEADVVTGGTSWLPLSTTALILLEAIPPHPVAKKVAVPSTSVMSLKKVEQIARLARLLYKGGEHAYGATEGTTRTDARGA
jgi:hypothetical protein